MVPARHVEKSQGGSVLAGLALVFSVAAVGLLVASAIAVGKTEMVRRRWEGTFGSREEVLRRYPSSGANAAALELERLAAALGIDIVPRSCEDRERPSEEQDAEHEKIESALGDYLIDQLQLPRRSPLPPPEPLLVFLEEHADEIEALRRQLFQAEVPRWERDIEELLEAPIPNLLGLIHLQKLLLAHSLVRGQKGRHEDALASLDASWQLNRSLREEPILITQLVSLAVARFQAGVLRQLPEVPDTWRDRLREDDYRESFMNALRFEAWAWAQTDYPESLMRGRLWRMLHRVGRPYLRFCLSDVSEDYRQRLEKLAEAQVLCDADAGVPDAALDVPIPRWNLVGKTIVPNMVGVLDRLRRLELDLELTRKVLEIEAARRENGGTWPDAIAGIEGSSVCPDDRWVYEAAPGGPMSIAFGREISWPGHTGLILPTRFGVERLSAQLTAEQAGRE